jgi:hypothetical protein
MRLEKISQKNEEIDVFNEISFKIELSFAWGPFFIYIFLSIL